MATPSWVSPVKSTGKALREAVADRSGPTSNTLAVIRQLLERPDLDVNDSNRNGKSAIHFAAQLRSDTEVLALLLESKADVNATTHRGHTPLIYAAGRSRSNVVTYLLDHGANAATWTVNGDSAVSMGRNKGLPEDILLRLEANLQTSSQRRDFRGDERALAAQAEHRLHCVACRRRAEASQTHEGIGQPGPPSPVEAAATELAAVLRATARESTAALTAALLLRIQP